MRRSTRAAALLLAEASNLSKSPCSAIRARFMALTPISAVARKLPIFDRRLLFRTFLARLKTLLLSLAMKNNTSNYWALLPLFLTILGHCFTVINGWIVKLLMQNAFKALWRSDCWDLSQRLPTTSWPDLCIPKPFPSFAFASLQLIKSWKLWSSSLLELMSTNK